MRHIRPPVGYSTTVSCMDVTRRLSSASQFVSSQKYFCIHVRSSVVFVRQRPEEHLEEKVKRKGAVDVRDYISVVGNSVTV